MSWRVGMLAVAVAVGGCAPDEPDLKNERAELTKDMRARVAPLPQVIPIERVRYGAGNLQDPFYPAEQKK